MSYTELEFGTATREVLPRLVFLLDEVTVVPVAPGRPIGSQVRVNNSPPIHRPCLGGQAGLCCAMVRSPGEGEPGWVGDGQGLCVIYDLRPEA